MRQEKPQSAMPKDWEPPMPAWSSQPSGETVVIAYLAAQSPDSALALEGLGRIRSFLDAGGGPGHVDFATSTIPDGPVDAFAVAYFADEAAYLCWAETSGFAAWWAEDARLSDACGYWQERLALPAPRIEALHSAPVPNGHSHVGTLNGPVREHAYWGGMRDRIAASREDWLASPLPSLSERITGSSGGRIVVEAPANLCIIRSGQDLADSDAPETELYDSVVRPNLIEGMRYLAVEGVKDGCCTARYATEIAPDGTPLPRTFGHCLFLSLRHLEDWAKSHPTHLAIFGSFFRLFKERDNNLKLRLWHEVSALPASGQHFEYLNCDPRTGIAGFFPNHN